MEQDPYRPQVVLQQSRRANPLGALIGLVLAAFAGLFLIGVLIALPSVFVGIVRALFGF